MRGDNGPVVVSPAQPRDNIPPMKGKLVCELAGVGASSAKCRVGDK